MIKVQFPIHQQKTQIIKYKPLVPLNTKIKPIKFQLS